MSKNVSIGIFILVVVLFLTSAFSINSYFGLKRQIDIMVSEKDKQQKIADAEKDAAVMAERTRLGKELEAKTAELEVANDRIKQLIREIPTPNRKEIEANVKKLSGTAVADNFNNLDYGAELIIR